MLGYAAIPNVHAVVLAAQPDADDRLYAHPVPAMTAAQALAADGQTPAAVVIFDLPDDEWASCCVRCYKRSGSTHELFCDAGRGPVMHASAVLRPAREVRS